MSRPLSELFLDRVIRIEVVQRERARAIKTGLIEVRNGVERRRRVVNEELVAFFKNGRIPGTTTTNEFRWSMDGFRPPRLYPDVGPRPISPDLQRAWGAALEQWVLLIGELREGKWIATGNGVPEGGRRGKIAPEQLFRDGLSYDVSDNAIYLTRYHGTWREETFRLVDTITVEAAPGSDIGAAQPSGEATMREAAGESEGNRNALSEEARRQLQERESQQKPAGVALAGASDASAATPEATERKPKANKQEVTFIIIRDLYPDAHSALAVLESARTKKNVWIQVADPERWKQACARLKVSYAPPKPDTISIVLKLFDQFRKRFDQTR